MPLFQIDVDTSLRSVSMFSPLESRLICDSYGTPCDFQVLVIKARQDLPCLSHLPHC